MNLTVHASTEKKALDFEGSIGPVYRFLRKVDEDIGQISSEATVRIETPPGDQAQGNRILHVTETTSAIQLSKVIGVIRDAQ